MNRVKTIWIAMACGLLTVSLDAAERGQTYTVPAWQWVKVANPSPVTQQFRNGESPLTLGKTCGIEPEGKVKVLGIEKHHALVSYQAPGTPMGTPCPSGVVFLVDIPELESWPAKVAARRQANDDEKALINRLLKP